MLDGLNKGVGAPAFLIAVINVLSCDFLLFITSQNSWEKKDVFMFYGPIFLYWVHVLASIILDVPQFC
jgi:hypothetical protein